METWRRSQFVVCHWDSRLMTQHREVQEDRISICVTSPCKLLAIPTIARSTGLELGAAVKTTFINKSLKNYKCHLRTSFLA